MNKRTMNVITTILVVVLAILGILIAINYIKLNEDIVDNGFRLEHKTPKYRYMVIIDGTDKDYEKSLIRGLNGAEEDFSVIYELWSFVGDQKDNLMKRQMDIGIESKVDGIIIQASDDEGYNALFKKAKLRDIPIITLGNEMPLGEKVSFITYNRYQLGNKIGTLLKEELNKKSIKNGKIVLLQNSSLVDQNQALALQEALGKTYAVKQVRADYEGENILNIEGFVRDVIKNNEDIRGIICFSRKETLGVIQGIKDLNKVNDILVIGSGQSEEVIDYVYRGVLHGTIIQDNERIGYEALLDLTKYRDGVFVSQYRDIDVQILTQETLELYREDAMGEIYE